MPEGSPGNWTSECGAKFRYRADAVSHEGYCPGSEDECPWKGQEIRKGHA